MAWPEIPMCSPAPVKTRATGAATESIAARLSTFERAKWSSRIVPSLGNRPLPEVAPPLLVSAFLPGRLPRPHGCCRYSMQRSRGDKVFILSRRVAEARMPEKPEAHDVWATGAGYQAYVGRWSRLVAREFLGWLGVPPTSRLAGRRLRHGRARRGDRRARSTARGAGGRSLRGVRRARPRAPRDGPRIAFQVGDAQALPVADGGFDAVVSGLVLNFVPEPARMVAEMARAGAAGEHDRSVRVGLRRPHGAHAAASGTQRRRSTRRRPRSTKRSVSRAARPRHWRRCSPRRACPGVATRAIDVPTRFRDFDDYWSPFLAGQGPAPAYAMSLPEDRRIALREGIRSTLPIATDGSIALTARAWAVRGSTSPCA